MIIFKKVSLGIVLALLMSACGYQTSQIRDRGSHIEVRAAHSPGFMLKNAFGGSASVYLQGGGLIADSIEYGTTAPTQVLVKPAMIGGAETMNILVDISSGGQTICVQSAVLKVGTPITWVISRPPKDYYRYNRQSDPACVSSFSVGAEKRSVLGQIIDVSGVSIGTGGRRGSNRPKGPSAW